MALSQVLTFYDMASTSAISGENKSTSLNNNSDSIITSIPFIILQSKNETKRRCKLNFANGKTGFIVVKIFFKRKNVETPECA